MGIQLYIFLLVLFVHSLNLDQYYSDPKEALQATQGICPILVALHSQRTLQTRSASIAHYCQDSELTSLQGPCLYCPHSAQDDGANQDTLALQVLLTPKQDECSSLRTMRHTMASMHRRVLCAWSQEDRDQCGHLELCRMATRRIAMGIYTAETQIAEKDQKDAHTPTKSREREREECFYGAGIRPTMECQGPSRNNDGSVIWIRSSNSATAAVSGQQTPKQRSTLISTGDSADHRRDHRYKDYFQEHASSSQEGGPCTCKVQSGKSSTPQAPQFLDCLCGREYQEVEYVRRRLHPERHCNEEELNKAREALQEARRHLDATKEQHSKQDAEVLEETEIISDGEAEDETMKIDTAAMIQKRIHSVVESLEQIQLPNADDTADPKGEGTSKRQRLDASALGSRALSPFPEPGK